MLQRLFLATAAFAFAASTALAANPQVELDTTAGVIKIELYPDAAPKTVANFLDYVKAKYYDGTQFHRVIDGFMIQGGGFTPDFSQKPTRPPGPHRGRVIEQGRAPERARAPSRWRAPAIPIPRRRSSSSTSTTTSRSTSRADGKALATRCSARSSPAWTSSTRSPRAPTGAGGPFPKDVPVEKVIIKSAKVVTPAS